MLHRNEVEYHACPVGVAGGDVPLLHPLQKKILKLILLVHGNTNSWHIHISPTPTQNLSTHHHTHRSFTVNIMSTKLKRVCTVKITADLQLPSMCVMQCNQCYPKLPSLGDTSKSMVFKQRRHDVSLPLSPPNLPISVWTAKIHVMPTLRLLIARSETGKIHTRVCFHIQRKLPWMFEVKNRSFYLPLYICWLCQPLLIVSANVMIYIERVQAPGNAWFCL